MARRWARWPRAVRGHGLPCVLVDDGSGPRCAAVLDGLAAARPRGHPPRPPSPEPGQGRRDDGRPARGEGAGLHPCAADRRGRAARHRRHPALPRAGGAEPGRARLRDAHLRRVGAQGPAVRPLPHPRLGVDQHPLPRHPRLDVRLPRLSARAHGGAHRLGEARQADGLRRGGPRAAVLAGDAHPQPGAPGCTTPPTASPTSTCSGQRAHLRACTRGSSSECCCGCRCCCGARWPHEDAPLGGHGGEHLRGRNLAAVPGPPAAGALAVPPVPGSGGRAALARRAHHPRRLAPVPGPRPERDRRARPRAGLEGQPAPRHGVRRDDAGQAAGGQRPLSLRARPHRGTGAVLRGGQGGAGRHHRDRPHGLPRAVPGDGRAPRRGEAHHPRAHPARRAFQPRCCSG